MKGKTNYYGLDKLATNQPARIHWLFGNSQGIGALMPFSIN
jgi:hypothetical protein